MKFIDLSKEDRTDVLDRVSSELNIRQREVMYATASVKEQWKSDYENMRLHMIYGDSVSFEELVEYLRELNDKINSI